MKKDTNEKIDFVVLWVDGSDEKWLEEKNKYLLNPIDISNQKNRFRDWDNLRYWFRGVEKYASWVNKIYFVTWGHTPKWLDLNNPKLKIVKHEDFIPKEYLPTYNSNVIQFYLNRIEGISDKFVMFDDDQFIIKNVYPSDFYNGDKICDNFVESVFSISNLGDVYPHSLLNNIQCINENYNKKKFYKENWKKIFSFKNGFKLNMKTLSTVGYNNFIGIYSPHICQAYTKKHYDLFWKYCNKHLIESSKNKFRDYNDLTTFLIRYIALVEGDFVPRNISFGQRFELSEDNKGVYSAIEKQKYNVVCINDSKPNIDFEKTKKELINSFEKILPEKSSFEK